jgi:hypothetical protein
LSKNVFGALLLRDAAFGGSSEDEGCVLDVIETLMLRRPERAVSKHEGFNQTFSAAC